MICAQGAGAQSASIAVTKITVTGLSRITEKEFLYMFGIKEGETIDAETISKGIKTAFLKGCFNDIKVYADGGIVSVEVLERPVIDSVVVDVAGPLSSKKIKAIFTLKEDGEFYNALIEPAVAELKRTLTNKGLPDAKIKYEILKGKKPAGVIVALTVDEGQPLIIKRVVIDAPDNHAADEIKGILNIKEGDAYDKDEIDSQIEKAKELMIKKLLYFNPAISGGVYDNATGTLTINVNPGKKLVLTFKGNDKLSEGELKKEMPFVEYGSVNEDTIEEAIASIETLYHKNGFINVNVDYEKQDKQNEIELLFTITEGRQYTLSDIVFTGTAVSSEKLSEAMPSKKDAPYNPDIDEDDETAITDLLQNEGYQSAAVKSYTPQIDEAKNSVTLRIEIYEGNRIIIKDIQVEGNSEVAAEKIIAASDIKVGRPYVETEMFNARQTTLAYLTHQGYADADVKFAIQGDTSDKTLILHVSEGKRYSFGDTIVRGNVRTNWEVFRRVLKHTKGQPLNMALAYEEMRELYKTSLFTSVNVSAVDSGDGVKDIVFDVSEADAGTIDYGIGYGDYEKLRGFFEVKYINLQGMDRQIAFKSRLSQVSRNLSLTYDEPWFLGYKLPFNATLLYERKEQRNIDSGEVLYRTEKYSSSVGVGMNFTEKLKGVLSYEVSFTNTWDVQPDAVLTTEDTGTLVISSIVPSLIYDSRDNPFNPTSGILTGTTLKVASKALFSQANFAKLSGYVNYYHGLSKGLILAMSLKTGVGQGWANTVDMPIIERFFLGGSTTVRGYSQDGLGPKGSSGDPTGGNAYLMGSSEMRISVIDNFGVVTFLDCGDVWPKISDYSLSGLKYTTGMGLRYMTAAGPIRLDYGYKLNRAVNEGTGRFYFSIGQAF
ncbi:MAG: outer membrane protein assembly factor BamA [Candidatus Magnetominusculus sp. LBB02]|nr:outer membrane protein assembly factor BamA [Candidatus Magnetominusculus sp. LBB02]